MSENHEFRIEGWSSNSVLHCISSCNILYKKKFKLFKKSWMNCSVDAHMLSPWLPQLSFPTFALWSTYSSISFFYRSCELQRIPGIQHQLLKWLLGLCLDFPKEGKLTSCYSLPLYLLQLSTCLLCARVQWQALSEDIERNKESNPMKWVVRADCCAPLQGFSLRKSLAGTKNKHFQQAPWWGCHDSSRTPLWELLV